MSSWCWCLEATCRCCYPTRCRLPVPNLLYDMVCWPYTPFRSAWLCCTTPIRPWHWTSTTHSGECESRGGWIPGTRGVCSSDKTCAVQRTAGRTCVHVTPCFSKRTREEEDRIACEVAGCCGILKSKKNAHVVSIIVRKVAHCSTRTLRARHMILYVQYEYVFQHVTCKAHTASKGVLSWLFLGYPHGPTMGQQGIRCCNWRMFMSQEGNAGQL